MCTTCICLFVNVYYVFIYLILFIGRIVGGLIPLTNIWCELDLQILRELLKKPN